MNKIPQVSVLEECTVTYSQPSLPIIEVVGVDNHLCHYLCPLALVMADAPAILEFQAISPLFRTRPAQGIAFKLLKYILATPQSIRTLSQLLAYHT